MRLAGRAAVITGASTGIGRASALRFADEGARLVLADIDERSGRSTLEKVLQLGAQATFVQSDISREDDARPLPHEKEERLQKERDVAERSIIPGTVKDGHADSLASDDLGQLIHAKAERPPHQK